MSDKKTIRGRTVYDIVTLVAEVSGFADFFMIFFGFVMNVFVQPRSLESALLSHLKLQIQPKKKS
jgi:hypothetical protein